MDTRYPDAIAVTYDPVTHWLSCVYNDHSLYVWDVRDVKRVGKVHSALYHAACVWDLEVNRHKTSISCIYTLLPSHSAWMEEARQSFRIRSLHSPRQALSLVAQMFPDAPGDTGAGLSTGAFISCSADNTIRAWHSEEQTPISLHPPDALSRVSFSVTRLDVSRRGSGRCSLRFLFVIIGLQDLLNMIYIDRNTSSSLDQECKSAGNVDRPGDGQAPESRTGIRTICISPDAKHLASGDRNGILRWDRSSNVVTEADKCDSVQVTS